MIVSIDPNSWIDRKNSIPINIKKGTRVIRLVDHKEEKGMVYSFLEVEVLNVDL